VDGAYSGALPVKSAHQVHEAGVIDGGANFGAGIFHVTHFLSQHCGGNIAVFNGEGATEAAATIYVGQLDEFDSADVSQEAEGHVAQMQAAERMATGVVGDSVRVISAYIFDAEFMDEQLGELEDAGKQILDRMEDGWVAGGGGHSGVVIADHGEA
jgi:hypothetical protein